LLTFVSTHVGGITKLVSSEVVLTFNVTKTSTVTHANMVTTDPFTVGTVVTVTSSLLSKAYNSFLSIESSAKN
jgi:hypothetical protein